MKERCEVVLCGWEPKRPVILETGCSSTIGLLVESRFRIPGGHPIKGISGEGPIRTLLIQIRFSSRTTTMNDTQAVAWPQLAWNKAKWDPFLDCVFSSVGKTSDRYNDWLSV